MSFRGLPGLMEKEVSFRLQNGEITTLPLAWIRGAFGQNAFTTRRVKARLKADQPKPGVKS